MLLDRRRTALRHLLALIHVVLLVVVSTSAAYVPCAHATPQHEIDGSPVADHSVSHAMMHHGADAPSTSPHRTPHSPTTTCPWIMGCVGMIRLELDAAWRSVEGLRSQPAPSSVTLAYVTVDRDIESPPPRA